LPQANSKPGYGSSREQQAASAYDVILRWAYVGMMIIAIACGVGFRFYHLSVHGFGGDEGITALHVAGYASSDVRAALARPKPVPVSIVHQFRTVAARGPADTIRVLATEDAQHPPAYYIAAQVWERLVGSGVVKLRVFTAALSLLLLPAVYWLCMELFGSKAIAWAGTAIVALSPLNVEYAQQAREYATWMVLTVAASAVLLRALKTDKLAWWVAYGAATAAGLYTDGLYTLVVLAHVLYVCGLVVRGERRFLPFFTAVVCGMALATPWYVLLVKQRILHIGPQSPFQLAAYAVHKQDLMGVLYAWAVALAAPFVDLEAIDTRFYLVVGAVIVLVLVAFVLLIRRTPFRVWWFLVTLGSPLLILQIGNTGMTNMPRYMIPTMLMLELLVGWLIGSLWTAASPRLRPFVLASSSALLVLMFVDCAVRGNASVWWTDPTDLYWQPITAIAEHIDASGKNTLVISSSNSWELATDVAALLPASDRLWTIGDRRRWRAALRDRSKVYILSSRAQDLPARNSSLQPLPVTVPARGYVLLRAVRARASRVTTVTELWQVK
jgi:uncharacterized membrane protein